MPSVITNYGGKYNFRKPYKPLTEMSLEELQLLQGEWWRQAEDSGLLEDCTIVAENLLAEVHSASAFSVVSDPLDGITVLVNGQRVLNRSTRVCVPGEWIRKIRQLLEEYYLKQKNSLLETLTLKKDWKV